MNDGFFVDLPPEHQPNSVQKIESSGNSCVSVVNKDLHVGSIVAILVMILIILILIATIWFLNDRNNQLVQLNNQLMLKISAFN